MNSEVRIAASLVRPFYGRAEKGFPMVFGCNADFLWKGLFSTVIGKHGDKAGVLSHNAVYGPSEPDVRLAD
jgi:hypothetical protein